MQPIGLMTLNANPTNYFAETEQVAFHLGHLVPGIDVTDDPLLQARLFSYLDTQLTRLGGPNFAPDPDQPAARAGQRHAARRLPPDAPCTAASRRTGRTRWTAAARSSPGADTGAFIEVPRAGGRGEQGARAARRRSTTTSARPGCSGSA